LIGLGFRTPTADPVCSDPMSEQPHGGSTGRWLKRITQSMSGEPRDLAELVENLREASERGLFDGDALVMLEGVLAVADMQVRDIMVPRSQMVFVERDESPEKLVELVVESGHSRFPVIGEDRDQILGILLAKDLLRLQAAADEDFEIREYMRPVVFVPESKRLNVLLKEFRRSHNHIAMVVDEYGGVCGLVTIEDVIEQIVGEIDDEHDVEDDQTILKERPREFTVRALTPIANFNQHFSTAFADEEYDTIGGLLMQEFGRLPRRGETIKIGGLEFRVLRADRRRIDLLRVTVPFDIEPPAAHESSA
jgi:magnesium and cobalt transporter